MRRQLPILVLLSALVAIAAVIAVRMPTSVGAAPPPATQPKIKPVADKRPSLAQAIDSIESAKDSMGNPGLLYEHNDRCQPLSSNGSKWDCFFYPSGGSPCYEDIIHIATDGSWTLDPVDHDPALTC